MKSFKTYLKESQQVYHYRIKMVVPPTEEHMEDLERLLRRYDVQQVSMPHKIDAKMDSLEFRDIENVDVYSIDVQIGMPLSAYILQQELRAALNLPEKFLVVRADNEPVEVESTRRQMLRQLDKIAAEKGLTAKASLLSTDSHYLDAEQPIATDVFGDKYNKTFLNYLADVAAGRKTQIFDTDSQLIDAEELSKAKREPSQDVADFNDAFDTPRPVPTAKAGGKSQPPVDPSLLTTSGNFDDDTKTYFKLNRNPKGQLVTTTIDAMPIRSRNKK